MTTCRREREKPSLAGRFSRLIQLIQILIRREVGQLIQHQHIVGLIRQRLHALPVKPQIQHRDGVVIPHQERQEAVGKAVLHR